MLGLIQHASLLPKISNRSIDQYFSDYSSHPPTETLWEKHKYLCKSLNNQTVNDLIKINMKALITSSIDVTSHHFHK